MRKPSDGEIQEQLWSVASQDDTSCVPCSAIATTFVRIDEQG